MANVLAVKSMTALVYTVLEHSYGTVSVVRPRSVRGEEMLA